MTVTRGTTNRNQRGGSHTRRRRREWLVETYRANQTVVRRTLINGGVEDVAPLPENLLKVYNLTLTLIDMGRHYVQVELVAVCRCFRCGCLLTVDTVTVDRIIPGCKGGTYRRNNIRPACLKCNSETGGALRGAA